MQFLSKLFFVLSLLAVISFTSCNQEEEGDCTVCDELNSTFNGGIVYLTEVKICIGDSDGAGGVVTQEYIDDIVETYRAVGGTCN